MVSGDDDAYYYLVFEWAVMIDPTSKRRNSARDIALPSPFPPV